MSFSSTTPSLPLAYLQRLDALHRELSISPRYAADRHLTPHPEANEDTLVQIGLNDEGRPIRLVPEAAEAWTQMRNAAADSVEKLTLIPISGFRSVARQVEIIRGKLAGGRPIDDILRSVAAPGFSEHHTARAIDIASPEHIELDEDFARTAAYRWLEQHARRFGFVMSYPRDNPHGIVYEPWHWCWQPGGRA